MPDDGQGQEGTESLSNRVSNHLFRFTRHSPESGIVPEGVDRMDVLKAFLGQGPGEILLTDPVDTVAGKLLPSLIDKKTVLIKGFWGDTIFFDIETKELRGPFLDIDQAESVPLSQDGQGVLLGVEVVDMEGGNLGSPGP